MAEPRTPIGLTPLGPPQTPIGALSLSSQRTDAEFDEEEGGRHPRDMSITLEPEFYTCAFVSPLQLGQHRENHTRVCGELFFAMAMLFVASMQCITVLGMSAYLVEKDAGYLDEFKLSMALFTEGGSPMAPGSIQDVCGDFSQIALEHTAGSAHLRMPDGTLFSGVKDAPAFRGEMPLFHSYKMPSGNWVFDSIGGDESYIDKLLRMLHRGDWAVPTDFRVEYGTLFVIMLCVLWYHVLFELRKIVNFMQVLLHLFRKGLLPSRKGTTSYDSSDGSIVIERLNSTALVIGCLCVTMRLAVCCLMMTWGTTLLAASSNKLSLVLNSIAIGIIFELDVIVAYAVVDHNTIARIEKIKPITLRMPSWTHSNNRVGMNDWDIGFSIFMLLGVFVGACLVRKWQVDDNTHQLHNAAALCLFAGPTPQGLHDAGPRPDLLAPVPGFCESLLSLTCAPNVTGIGNFHGPCLVTDQEIYKDQSVMLYADGKLFDNMYDVNGQRRSMNEWGKPHQQLTSSKTWIDDENLNLFRRACMQLYNPGGMVDKRLIDSSLGMTTYSAPFYCPREKLFQAVFGHAVNDFGRWHAKFDLQGPGVVAALDECHKSSQRGQLVAELAGSPSPAVAPTTAPSVPSGVSPVADAAALGDGVEHPLPINTLVVAVRAQAKGEDEVADAQAKFLEHRKHRQRLRHHRDHRSHQEVSQQVILAQSEVRSPVNSASIPEWD